MQLSQYPKHEVFFDIFIDFFKLYCTSIDVNTLGLKLLKQCYINHSYRKSLADTSQFMSPEGIFLLWWYDHQLEVKKD